MDQFTCPVDVICVCNAQGEIRPLRLQLSNAEQMKFRVDILEILNVKHIPYVNAEADVYLCRAKADGHEMTVELKYAFRSHSWYLLQKLY